MARKLGHELVPNLPAFDTSIFCDWSASSAPKAGRDSIWLCRGHEVVNPRTRRAAMEILFGWIARSRRTLVGWDFTFGLPAASYAHFGFPNWRAYWQYLSRHVQDGARNENNRFAVASALNERAAGGPFWGAPPSATNRWLGATKPPADPRFPELREVERVLRAQKRRPFSPWQLLGNGSVGSQALVGIPCVHALRTHPALRARSRVWPFESIVGAEIVHCEAGPIAIDVDASLHPVRDAAQMLSLSARARGLTATLGGRRSAVVRAEGWVLGVC